MGRDVLSMDKPQGATRLIFATDLHGSTKCFRQLLRLAGNGPADVIVVGGDVTGKRIVPIIQRGPAGHHFVPLYKGQQLELSGRTEVAVFEAQLADEGIYGYRCDEVDFAEFSSKQVANDSVWRSVVENRIAEWAELASAQLSKQRATCFFNAGNDDFFFVDEAIDASGVFVRPEGKVVPVDEHLSMISCGYANLTPFSCPRDVPEERIAEIIAEMADRISDLSRCIFNLHCPPQGTTLDKAAKLNGERRRQLTALGVEEDGVGSVAVREAIEKYQPAVSLHGHIHESAAHEYLGRCLCINPGSEYSEGILRFAILDFTKGKLVQWGRGRCDDRQFHMTHWFDLTHATCLAEAEAL